jgi:diguanylate cyclase (GGDEF)-like protein
MSLVLVCWVLAMVAGLWWARVWTGSAVALTMLAFIWTQSAALAAWTGWVQLAVLTMTPWLLAAQREREEALLQRLHAQEAAQVARLADAARELMSLRAETQRLEQQISEIADVYRVTKETARTLHLSELFDASLELTPRLLSIRGLRLIDLAEGEPHVLRATLAGDGRLVRTTSNHGQEVERAILQRVAVSGTSASATGAELAVELPQGVHRVAWAPLWREQRPVGVLVAEEVPDAQVKTLAMIANQLALQLSRIHLYAKVEALAVRDALTNVFVRGYFMERAREEIVRSKRHGLSCTLLMADLDHFKQKNDTYGHLVGDLVLKDVAQLLSRNLREVDLIARYGGEEFILLLIETEVEQAMPIAQRLRQLVEVHPVRAYDELLPQTVSLGAAGFPEDGQTLEELLEHADQALYAAKRAGRNQVIRWTKDLPAVSEA